MLLQQEKSAFIEQSKMISQVEIENKLLKKFYWKAMVNIKNEVSKILATDGSFRKLVSKVNRSDSVHVNPTFGETSGRVHSQNSIPDQENSLEVDREKDPMNSNFINLHNYQPFGGNKNEWSGFAGNNISGTTGGDDDPALKFNNVMRRSDEEKKEISFQSLKRLSRLQEFIWKYEKVPMKELLNAHELKNCRNNKEIGFNQTFTQDSLSQVITSFFTAWN